MTAPLLLHAEENENGGSEGKERGAYYTPLPLVNYMIDTMSRRRPLRRGMRILDPACGSGVFLVQCYRQLIEKLFRKKRGRRLRPTELRELLIESVFGIDTDQDACRVAEFSLILTLLDYVTPPDLKAAAKFKLPMLVGQNIHCGNAFGALEGWAPEVQSRRFDWVIGNPPWKDLSAASANAADKVAWEWIKKHGKQRPIGGNQLADAFLWRSCEFGDRTSLVGLVVPAMTLFKYESADFRRTFFSSNAIWSVANFSNLAEVLFAGRSRVPAAVVFYSPNSSQHAASTLEVFSPLVANQLPTAPTQPQMRRDTWCIVVNKSEVKLLSQRDIASGDMLPWKLAMWGSPVDQQIISRTRRNFTQLHTLETEKILRLSQGLELRDGWAQAKEPLDEHQELIGKQILDVKLFRGSQDYLFEFPEDAITEIRQGHHFVRRGRFEGPFEVSLCPHIIVSAARNFAVYMGEDLVVPAGQVGIRQLQGDPDFLKALALFLNSDFALYFQILLSPQLGVQRAKATLDALRELPVPFALDDAETLKPWSALFERISHSQVERDILGKAKPRSLDSFLQQINDLSFQALRLGSKSRASIEDLVRVKTALFDGKVEQSATSSPSEASLREYALALRQELDTFLKDAVAARHKINILFDSDFGAVEVALLSTTQQQPVSVSPIGYSSASRLTTRSRLLEQRTQWVYFNRALKIYRKNTTYVLKPMQTVQWLRSQAIEDANEIIAETLESRKGFSPSEAITA